MNTERPLYSVISIRLYSMLNCERNGNREWCDKHRDRIEEICKHHLPSGAGFDAGTSFVFDASTPERLVFNAPFHHMDEHGGYDGWSEHQVVVTPSLVSGFELQISGADRDEIADYIADVFNAALSETLVS